MALCASIRRPSAAFCSATITRRSCVTGLEWPAPNARGETTRGASGGGDGDDKKKQAGLGWWVAFSMCV